MIKEIVECECYSDNHTLQFIWFEDEADTMYITVHLTPFSFFQRILYAIKYIFGKPCKFGCFEEYVWSCTKVKQVQLILNKFINQENRNEL